MNKVLEVTIRMKLTELRNKHLGNEIDTVGEMGTVKYTLENGKEFIVRFYNNAWDIIAMGFEPRRILFKMNWTTGKIRTEGE